MSTEQKEQETEIPEWKQSELTDMFEQIQMGFSNIYSLFKENFQVAEDDEDMEGLKSAMDFLNDHI